LGCQARGRKTQGLCLFQVTQFVMRGNPTRKRGDLWENASLTLRAYDGIIFAD
jgi:hypothetical protein